jgi:uncharacterized protein (TIGR03546 family)
MPLLLPLFKLFDLIVDESSPFQISGGVVLGMYLGLTPPLTLHYALLGLVFLLIRLNLLCSMLSFLFFSVVGLVAQPAFDLIGSFLLTGIPSMATLWAALYHSPILPYTRFNNTVVMGSFVFCVFATIPLYLVIQHLVSQFYSRFFYRVTESSLARTWRRSGLCRLYEQSHKN